MRRRIAIAVLAAAVVVALCAAIWPVARTIVNAPEVETVLDPAKIRPWLAQGNGHAFVHPYDTAPSDSMAAPTASAAVLLEDDVPIGPPHSLHADIDRLGNGRFSHWQGNLIFSTTDNSDPRSNGRRYTVGTQPAPRHVVVQTVRWGVTAGTAAAVALGALIWLTLPRTFRRAPVALFASGYLLTATFSAAVWSAFTFGAVSSLANPSLQTLEYAALGSALLAVVAGFVAAARLRWYARVPLRAITVTVVIATILVGFVHSGDPRVLAQSYALYSPWRGHQLNPHWVDAYSTGGERIHTANGFRGVGAPALEKAPATIRVVAMGGSALYGVGATGAYPHTPYLRNDELVTHHLQKALNGLLERNGAAERVEIINAGVAGYHTFQHLIYFNETIYEYRPDIVLFLDGHNDFYYPRPDRNEFMDYGYSSVWLVDAFNNRRPVFALYTLARTLTTYNYTLFSGLEKALKLLWENTETTPGIGSVPRLYAARPAVPPEATFEDLYRETARNTYLKNYALLARAAEHFGAEIMVYLQPEIWYENPAVLSEADRRIKALAQELYGFDGVVPARMRSLMPEMFAAIGVPFHDVSEIGAASLKDSQLYLDHVHLSGDGTKALAIHMLPALFDAVFARTALAGASPRAGR